MNHKEVADNAVFFWARIAWSIAAPVAIGVSVYFGLLGEIKQMRADFYTHEQVQVASIKAAESVHTMLIARLDRVELKQSSVIAFLNRVSEQLKITFNL